MEMTARDENVMRGLDPVRVAQYWRWCGAVGAEAEALWAAGQTSSNLGNTDVPDWVPLDDYAQAKRFCDAVTARLAEIWADWGSP